MIQEGERVPVSNPTGLVMPTSDILVYLQAAKEIQLLESEANPDFDIYGF